MNPYEPPVASFERLAVPESRDVDWKSVLLAVGVYLIAAFVFSKIATIWSVLQFGVITILLCFYIVPPAIGALFLAIRTRHRWLVHGFLYAGAITTVVTIIVCLFGPRYLLEPGVSVIFRWFAGVSLITLVTMGITRVLVKTVQYV